MKKPAKRINGAGSPPSRPTTHNFRGVQYRIAWRKPKIKSAGGTCDPPTKKNCTIEVWPKLDDFNRLRVLIDEGIHACHFDLDNDAVGDTSTCIANLLWRCGLRFTK
jgi:hypothetical protein